MSREIKPLVEYEETFGKLDIRVGRIVEIELEESTPRETYRMLIDFGKFGKKTSYGRFTRHSSEEMKGQLVLAVLNFESRQMGSVCSEVLTLGVQYPKAESGEATFVSPLKECKIGSKLF